MKGSRLALTAVSALLIAPASLVFAQAPGEPAATPAQPAQAQPATPGQPGSPVNATGAIAQPPGGVPQAQAIDFDRLVDDLQGMDTMGRILFKMADTNNDNQISQREAIDAANQIVGGVFFRADLNGDGIVSQDEARQAIQQVLQQQPILHFVLDRAQRAPGQNNANNNQQADPVQVVMSLIDTDNDHQIKASELKQFVQTMVQGAFTTADANHDGQLSTTEFNSAAQGAVRMVAQVLFNAADTDHNGSISQEEFVRSAAGPLNAAFRILDANNDGQLSQQEADSAMRIAGQQLRNLRVPDTKETRSAAAPATGTTR